MARAGSFERRESLGAPEQAEAARPVWALCVSRPKKLAIVLRRLPLGVARALHHISGPGHARGKVKVHRGLRAAASARARIQSQREAQLLGLHAPMFYDG